MNLLQEFMTDSYLKFYSATDVKCLASENAIRIKAIIGKSIEFWRIYVLNSRSPAALLPRDDRSVKLEALSKTDNFSDQVGKSIDIRRICVPGSLSKTDQKSGRVFG